jgi:hypothetical protein
MGGNPWLFIFALFKFKFNFILLLFLFLFNFCYTDDSVTNIAPTHISQNVAAGGGA